MRNIFEWFVLHIKVVNYRGEKKLQLIKSRELLFFGMMRYYLKNDDLGVLMIFISYNSYYTINL